jgi:hypothetical protein
MFNDHVIVMYVERLTVYDALTSFHTMILLLSVG